MLKIFRSLARYNVLTPAALLGLILTGTAQAAEQVNAVGVIDTDGVQLASGDSLTNNGTVNNAVNQTAVSAGPNAAITFILNSATGTITATGTGQAIGIDGSIGTLTNLGAIQSEAFGVGASGLIGSFVNSGSIISTGDTAVGSNAGFGSVVNNAGAKIQGQDQGLGTNSNIVALENSGSIIGVNNDGIGIGGTLGNLTNNAGATIKGQGGFGINGNVTGTFRNDGTITATTNNGTFFGGTVGAFINNGTITSPSNAVSFDNAVGSFTNGANGNIQGGSNGGVSFSTTVSSFLNAGAISSNSANNAVYFQLLATRVEVAAGGSVINTNVNGVGVEMDAGTVRQGVFVNAGTVIGGRSGFAAYGNNGMASFTNLAGGRISSTNQHAITIDGALDSFSNAGSITGPTANTDSTVRLGGNIGTFTNLLAGTIDSTVGNAVNFDGTVGSFFNAGVITTNVNFDAVYFDKFASTFENTGTIRNGGNNSVGFNQGVGTFGNGGTISSVNGAGVFVGGNGGTLTNRSGGTITGETGIGINAENPGAVSITNAGTIEGTGGTAINYNWGNAPIARDDRLTMLTGARFIGNVQFGAGVDTLDFSSFSGNTVLNVNGLENVVAGDNVFVRNANQVAIIEDGAIQNAGQPTLDLLNQISSTIADQIDGSPGGAPDQEAPLGYVATRPVTPAAAAATTIGAEAPKTNTVWGSLIAGGSNNTALGQGGNVFGGIVAGTHALLNQNTTLGGVAGYVHSSYTVTRNVQTIRSDTGLVGAYGEAQFDAVALDFSLIGGFNGHHSERTFNAGLGTQTAVADFSSWFLSPQLGVSLPVLQTIDGEINVTASARYVGGGVAGYSEAGSIANLTVGNQSISLLDARFGFDGSHSVSGGQEGAVTLTGKAGVFVQSNLGGSTVPLTLLGQNTVSVVPGTTNYGIYGGVGISVPVAFGNLTGLLDGSIRNDGLFAGSAKIGLSTEF